MSKYEFLAEHALYPPGDKMDENTIDRVVTAQGEYRFLHDATVRARAQILSTGMWMKIFEEDSRARKADVKMVQFIKDGRNKTRTTTEILGYPGLLKGKYSDRSVLDFKLFLPDPEQVLLSLPVESFLVKITLRLLTPFYSRDDLAFYPHENPLRREWVFHWPYLSAAAVKGLLRWAWRMCHQDNLLDKEELLFGPRPRKEEKDEDKRQQGCLYTYPLFWEGKVGLDVINPHSRENNTGKIPIKYEVVKQGATGNMYILIFNRRMERGFLEKILFPLFKAIDFLLNDTAISAKRTAGWGSVKIVDAKIHLRGDFKKSASQEKEKAYAKIQQKWDEYKQLLAKQPNEPEVEIEKVKSIKLDTNISTWAEKIISINYNGS